MVFLNSTFYSSSSFRDIRGSKFTLGGPAPPARHLAENFPHTPSTCLISIAVKFKLRSSINVPSGDQPTAQGLYRRLIPIFPCERRRSKGVPSSTGDFLRLLVEELGIPKCWPNFAYWKCLYIDTMLPSDLNQRRLKTRHCQQRRGFCGCERCFPKQILVNKYFVWNSKPNMNDQ